MNNLDQHFHAFTCCVQLCNNRDKNASISLSLYSFASTSNTLQLVSVCPTVVSTLVFPFHHFDYLTAGISVVQLISVPTSALVDSASFSKVEPKVRAVDSLSLLRGVESSEVHKTSLSTSIFFLFSEGLACKCCHCEGGDLVFAQGICTTALNLFWRPVFVLIFLKNRKG